MRIIRRPIKTAAYRQGRQKCAALTIGNFDGVHAGHAALFREVVRAAKRDNLVPTVVTFDPHPKEFFNPDFKLPCISTLRDRILEMKRCGIEQICILPFDKYLSGLSPQEFVQEILINQLDMQQVWVGDDFRFGAHRAGNFELLEQLGKQLHFTVNDIAAVQTGGHRVSSSQIRQALTNGNIALAARMLGHSVTFSGHVVHGKKLGRTLGFPTLNMKIKGRATALNGILAVWVHGLQSKPLPAVASLGVRPTVEQSAQLLLETFIPNWSGDAYGKLLSIEVVEHLRGEQHFESLDAMVIQMHKDTERAMAIVQTHAANLQPCAR